MTTLTQKSTSLALSLALALPGGGSFAQTAGKEANPRLTAGVEQCGNTPRQTVYPCRLAVGGFATSQDALGEVRRRVQEALTKAQEVGKTLSPAEITAIVQTSPGIVQEQRGAAAPAPQPRPVAPAPQPQVVTPEPNPQVQPAQQAQNNLCGSTEKQRIFPCEMLVGAVAMNQQALAEARASVRKAQEQAQGSGRGLSAREIAEIVAGTPGILMDLPPLAEAPTVAPQPSAAAVAAGGQTQVVTEEITQGGVRSSDQEFDTAVTAEGQGSSGGLSKFEKALLLGLGAVAVGSILKNGDQIVSSTGDRVVVRNTEGDLRVLKDDDALLRRPGDQVQTETFNDGSTRTIVQKTDGTQVITIRGRDGAVLRRVNVDAQGNQYVLFDDTQAEQRVVVSELPQVQTQTLLAGEQNLSALEAALAAQLGVANQNRFSLRQVREISQVRALAPELELDAVRFQTGSAAIRPEQARSLARIGTTLSNLIARDPSTVILVEGHTDAVGDATYNLALSDRRAETVALALTEYFRVPPENLITQGYGESQLKILTAESEAANRRAVVRNITALLR